MTNFQWLGIFSISSLALALLLSTYAMFGKNLSKRRVYAISFTVLFLMLMTSVLCFIIYQEFGKTANWQI